LCPRFEAGWRRAAWLGSPTTTPSRSTAPAPESREARRDYRTATHAWVPTLGRDGPPGCGQPDYKLAILAKYAACSESGEEGRHPAPRGPALEQEVRYYERATADIQAAFKAAIDVVGRVVGRGGPALLGGGLAFLAEVDGL
jgi:hypothetical protein